MSGSQHNPHLREKRIVPFLLSVLLGKPGLVRHFLEGSPDFVAAATLEELAVKMNEVTGEESDRREGARARDRTLRRDDRAREGAVQR